MLVNMHFHSVLSIQDWKSRKYGNRRINHCLFKLHEFALFYVFVVCFSVDSHSVNFSYILKLKHHNTLNEYRAK